MIKLGKQTQYAMVALLHLGKIAPNTRVSTRELSERYAIPEPHLGKVLQKLSRAGLLQAEKGSQGGYELGQELSQLTLGDVMRAVDPRRPRRPAGHRILSAFPSCYVQGVVREVERRAVDQVESLPLDDVLSGTEEPQLMEKLA
jgi:Rrf2 family nitric oxide-sensitive transcriptional repressor